MARGRARTESACRARRRVTTGPGPAIQRPKTADSQRGCIGPALRAETAGTLISWGDPSAGLADQAGGAEVGAIPFADSAGGVLKVRSSGFMPITLLDLILIGVMLISGLLAMVRGFMREILS